MNKHFDAFVEKRKDDKKIIDSLNHSLGQYIMYAYNKPKEYPRRPFMSEPEQMPLSSPEEMERMAKRFTKRLGGEILLKDHGNKNRGTTNNN